MKKEHDFGGGKCGAYRKARGKSRITIYLDNDILEVFRERSDAAGRG